MQRFRRGATRWPWIIGLGVVAVVLLIISTRVCLSTGFRYGLWLDACPDGEFRQTIQVSAPGLLRGAKTSVSVVAYANYTTGPSDTRRAERLEAFTPTLALVGPKGETKLEPKEGFKRSGGSQHAEIELPKVDDGDYLLRAKVTSAIGDTTLDLPLPLYTPARIHVLTDRPLYEPGNTVKFRALALKASDLSPLDGRPGEWRVTNPQGEVLLEEKAPAGAWGVVSGSFPLDKGAESGAWTVTWYSGGVAESRSFTVKPFTLPRFRIDASSQKSFYRRHEKPVLKGDVKYSSGAPVAKAKVELSWNVAGEWPPPTSWTDGTTLPRNATTDENGAFSVDLPVVPDDLQGQVHLNAALAAVDPSGDRVEGAASVLLSEDAIAVTAVTELASGLVEGFNNRLFLRATTADGRLLEGVTLNVKRLWEPTDKGTDAKVDEDGVAALQVDPGPAVNVVIPAQPFRPPPKRKALERESLTNMLDEEGGEASLADRLAFDRIEKELAGCARYVHSSGDSFQASVLVHASGAVGGTSFPTGRLGGCAAKSLGALRFEPGKERLLVASWSINDEELPMLELEGSQGSPQTPPELEEALREAMFEVRDCLPSTMSSGTISRMATWRYDHSNREVALSWANGREGMHLGDGVQGCVEAHLAKVTLPKLTPQALQELENEGEDAAKVTAVGVSTFRVVAPEKYESVRPQPTIMEGYEFLVTAKAGKEVVGSTKLRMTPGAVPPLRLRASSQIVNPGETVVVELLRGPDYTGGLPDKLFLTHGVQSLEAKFDEKERKASFVVPADFEGWCGVQWGGAQVFVFVQPKGRLAVKVTPEKPRYAPGQVAQLAVETAVGGQGGPAAVGLFGVDTSLAQLTPLPGPDELAGLRPQVQGAAPFGGLDAQALSLGRVRGANAAAATLLRVSALPPPPESERAVAVNGSTTFDPNEPLVDRFYAVLGELHVQAREWERTAPANEKMSNRTMARLWEKALDAVEARKESARDAWGRRLRLHRLPADLLALTEPRQVIITGTRLPEDTENWSLFVSKEKP